MFEDVRCNVSVYLRLGAFSWGPFENLPQANKSSPFSDAWELEREEKNPNRALEATWIEMLVLHAEGTCH